MTKVMTIRGLTAYNHGEAMDIDEITVRFTSDRVGETLSLQSRLRDEMIVVPFEPIAQLIKETREDYETN